METDHADALAPTPGETASQPLPPRSRRSLLTAALGALGGLLAGRLGRPDAASAAAGGSIIMGASNDAGTSNTTLATASSGTAYYVYQNGTGTAIRANATGANAIAGFFTSTNGPGISGVTANNAKYGTYAANDAASKGTGAALRVSGQQNDGVVATTAHNGSYAVKATGANGTAVYASAIQQGLEAHGYRAVHGMTADSFVSAGVYGENTGTTDTYGVYGRATGTSNARGVFGEAAGATGVNTGVYGSVTAQDTGAAGVRGVDGGGPDFTSGVEGDSSSDGGQGVYGHTTSANALAVGVYGLADTGSAVGVWGQSFASGYAMRTTGDLFVNGDFTASGSKAGYVVDVAVNGGTSTLRQGDAVKLIGVRAPVLGAIPLMVVEAATKGDAVIGVVDRQAEISQVPARRDSATTINGVKGRGTSVKAGEHLLVVTLGAFAAATVDAFGGPINAGDRLSPGAKAGRLTKAAAVDVGGRKIHAAGENVGYALGELADGTGTIAIFVNPH